MSKQVMVCGVDCHSGDAHCNGYCQGESDEPPKATPDMIRQANFTRAAEALTQAEEAWYEYACSCDVGEDRTLAFNVYENIRRATRAEPHNPLMG